MIMNTQSPIKNVFVCSNPLIKLFLSKIRDVSTDSSRFRSLIKETTKYLIYESMSDLDLETIEIQTPVAKTSGFKIKNRFLVAPILRAGLSMVESIMETLPFAQIRHIGLYRNEETLQPVEYYVKLPNTIEENTKVIIADPMLATGGSAISAIDVFKKRGVEGKDIIFICLIASQYGLEKLTKEHDDIKIYCAVIDQKLNENGYIVPGLGDAGDRCFGT